MKNLLSLVLFVSVLVASGQTKDKKATDILDQVVAKTNSFSNFNVDFTYKMTNKEAGIDESKEGSIVVNGEKYRLNIAGQIVICDGETLWTYLPEDFEVMVNAVEENDESITLSNLLNKYNEKYKSKFLGELNTNGKNLEILELKPNEGKNYTKVEILVDKNEKLIHSFTIFDKNGSEYSYLIRSFEPNIQLSDTLFTFNPKKYPDVDVIDMR